MEYEQNNFEFLEGETNTYAVSNDYSNPGNWRIFDRTERKNLHQNGKDSIYCESASHLAREGYYRDQNLERINYIRMSVKSVFTNLEIPLKWDLDDYYILNYIIGLDGCRNCANDAFISIFICYNLTKERGFNEKFKKFLEKDALFFQKIQKAKAYLKNNKKFTTNKDTLTQRCQRIILEEVELHFKITRDLRKICQDEHFPPIAYEIAIRYLEKVEQRLIHNGIKDHLEKTIIGWVLLLTTTHIQFPITLTKIQTILGINKSLIYRIGKKWKEVPINLQ